MGYSPRGRVASDTTERLTLSGQQSPKAPGGHSRRYLVTTLPLEDGPEQ